MAVTELTAEHAALVRATLGEGPVWVERDRALWFVDIKAPRIHRFDPESGRVDAWDAPDQVGWVLPEAGGGFLAGLATGIHRFSPDHGRFELHHAVEPNLPDNRLNDVAVDPAGRIWFGSMDDLEAEPTGRLYALHDGAVRDSGAEPVVITNGPAIAPDGRTLYTVDTLARAIDAYAVDAQGRLGERRRFLDVDPAWGHPDGAVADTEGGLWVGFWGGWAARRFGPDGRMTHEVRFPVANVTKVALGGADGRTGYATTARKGLSADALAAQPLAGDLFTFRVDTPGVVIRPIPI